MAPGAYLLSVNSRGRTFEVTVEEGSNVAVAAATFLAVIVALFGDWIRARLFRPNLSVSLANPEGELSSIGSGEHQVRAWFYYIRVSSPRPWPKPTEAQVFVVRVQKRNPNGVYHHVWAGEIPLRWKHQEVHPLSRTIARDTDADFLFVTEDCQLRLWPLIGPNNLTPEYTEITDLVVTVQAHAKECSSQQVPIAIHWDGRWDSGKREMTTHLTVEVSHST